MRDESLNCEVFDTMTEVKVLIETWRVCCNTIRPHSSLEYRPPSPEFKIVDISLKLVQILTFKLDLRSGKSQYCRYLFIAFKTQKKY